MLNFEQIYNQIIISEGYKEVRNRITPILQSQISNFDPDLVKMVFMKHQKNKNKLPEEYRNIDAYFSKKFDNNIVNRYNELQNELNKIPDIQITKGDAKRSLYNSLKLAENNEYIFFKVPSHEDAVKLVRPGNNAPEGCNWPTMLPVTWCITADTDQGKSMWIVYTGDIDYNFVNSFEIISFDKKGIYIKTFPSNFYFAFRKHPLLNQQIESANMSGEKKLYQVNPKDFLAIQYYIDGHYETTQSPNDTNQSPHIKDWPDTVPVEWKKYCIAPINKSQFVPYDKFTINAWYYAISEQPKLIKYYNKYCKDSFPPDYWSMLLSDHPELIIYCNELNKFKKFDWELLLNVQPQFKDIAAKYGYKI